MLALYIYANHRQAKLSYTYHTSTHHIAFRLDVYQMTFISGGGGDGGGVKPMRQYCITERYDSR